MKKNIFRFRCLKWGDPEKFKMLPEDTTPRDGERPSAQRNGTARSDKTLLAVALAAILLALAFSL